MVTRLLVPLDGSLLAEAALPVTNQLAHKLDVPVTLFIFSSGTLHSRFTATVTCPIRWKPNAIFVMSVGGCFSRIRR